MFKANAGLPATGPPSTGRPGAGLPHADQESPPDQVTRTTSNPLNAYNSTTNDMMTEQMMIVNFTSGRNKKVNANTRG